MALQAITKSTTTPIITFAQPMTFTFDVASNEAILGYTVALSYFDLRYGTNSPHNSEEVAQVAVRLIPNLIGNTILITPQMLLANGSGAAAAENQDDSGRESTVTVTVVALVGTSPPVNNSLQLLNAYNIHDAAPPITVNASAYFHAFLAGFAASFSGEDREISTLSASVSASVNNGTELTLQASTALVGGSTASNYFADTGLVAFTRDIAGMALVDATVSIGSANKSNGATGTLSANLAIPAGFNRIVAAVPLINAFSIGYDGDSYTVAELAAGITSGPGFPGGSAWPLTASGTQTWGLRLNIWNDRMSNQYMEKATLTAKVLVQYA